MDETVAVSEHSISVIYLMFNAIVNVIQTEYVQ